MNTPISFNKANRLFWLARYVERVFISLNAVKKYVDCDIDGDSGSAYREYCVRLCIPDVYADAKDFRKKYLYDKASDVSIYRMLVNAFDNGIELRGDITSESLSYIHLALEVMEKCAVKNSKLSDLQPVADYMMSFWGSIDENVTGLQITNIIRLGRRLESLDMNVRLRTDWDLINQILKGGVLTNAQMLTGVTDTDKTLRLKELIERHSGENHGEDFDEIIGCINGLFNAKI